MVLESEFTNRRFGEVTGTRLINVHERVVAGPLETSSRCLESILDPEVSVWPFEHRVLELDNGLEVGSCGGHGPIRYTVVGHEPGRRVRFEFDPAMPIRGWHEFVLAELPACGVRWRHELVIDPVEEQVRAAIEPGHDVLIEMLLDRVEYQVGTAAPRGSGEGS